ncbi:MAG: glycine cleavage system protein H [Pirellulales bacterium]|nr:glycine cleavage system protein H [Pirellulales bacterium]
MTQPLVFMMGEFPAEIPADRQYAKNHMWAMSDPSYSTTIRFGFTAYAVRLLQDVYFLDWHFDAPAPVAEQQEIGSIESKKAESSLYSPLSGEISSFNVQLLADPSGINVDKYGEGWLFDFQPSDHQTDSLLSADQYVDHLAEVWEITQRTIKGQLN